MKIIKLGILYFLSLRGIRAKGENLIYFFSDCVSFRSPSPPPDLLLAVAVTTVGDFPGSSSPVGNHRFRGARGRSTRRWQPRRQTATHAPSRASFLRQLAIHAPAREHTCGRMTPFLVTRLHIQGCLAPSCRSIPPAVHPEPSSSTFLPILPPPPSVNRLLHGLGPLFFISSSTAVIRPPIRALFNPNVIQSPVKWIWQLKILFLLPLSLDLLLSPQKN